jgi:hypothetical protein
MTKTTLTLTEDMKTLLLQVRAKFGQGHRTLQILVVSILSLQGPPHTNKDSTPIIVFLFFMEVIQLLVVENNKYWSIFLAMTADAPNFQM